MTTLGPTQTATPRPSEPLRRAGFLWLALVATILIATYETTISIVLIWSNSATYGHGFLIVPICIYLVWRRWPGLSLLPVQPSALGHLVMLGAGLLWVVGTLADVALVQHFALAAMLQGSVLAVFGWRIAWAAVFPMGYLLLAVPFGDFTVAPLQDLTAKYTVPLVRMSGVPVYLENWHIQVPGGSFLVAEACAGARYLLACIALGLLVCDLLLKAWWKRVLFMALSVAVPIVANVFRAYGIIMLAYVSGFEIAVDVDHLVYGGVFLSLVTLILLGFAFWMRDADAGGLSPVAAAARGRGAPTIPAWRSLVFACVAGLAVLVAMRGYAGWANASAGGDVLALSVPDRVGTWVRVDTPPPWRGDFRGADREGAWVYRDGDRQVTLFVAYYADERPGAELVSGANSFLGSDPKKTDLLKLGRASYGDFDGLPAPIYRRLKGPAYPMGRVVWSWYRVGAAVTASGPVAKLERLKAKLLGTAAPSLAVAVSTTAGPAAGETLSDFVAELDGLSRVQLIPIDGARQEAAR